jgi:hypothetical protein
MIRNLDIMALTHFLKDRHIPAMLARTNWDPPACTRLSALVGDEILTHGYVKPRDQWFPTEGTPRPTPPGLPEGSRRYTHWVRSHEPSDKET